MPTQQIRYFSMFSGIGGFELGIQKGFEYGICRGYGKTSQGNGESTTPLTSIQECEPNLLGQTGLSSSNNGQEAVCIGYSEIDKYAIQIYSKHYGGHKNYGNATTINTADLPDFDLLVGGFPCQAFSIAGKRQGFNDTRGTLFYEIARICADKRPRCILLENVKGLLSHDNGKTFQTILGVFSDLGYDIQWQVLNSKNFGVPQNRERVFIVGYFGGEGRRQVFPITRNDEENIKRLPEGYNSSTLTTRVGSTAKQQPLVRAILTPDRAEKRQNGRRVKENGEPSFTLTGQDIHGVVLSPSLTTELAHSTGRDFTPNIAKALFKEGCQIRRLTPTECERLQGFPDGWTKYGIMGGKKVEISDSQRYKCLGNAVTTSVITEIIKRMFTKLIGEVRNGTQI